MDHTISIIVMEDIYVAFGQDDGTVRPVLRRVNLEVRKGEAVAIVGGNGSGKSTLLRVLAGLSPTSRGTVKIEDSRFVSLVFQNPDAQMVGETVIEDICFGLENLAVPREQMSGRAARALAEVGLSGFESRKIEQLSGGQKQLVCIASAIALDTSVLVLDEPTAMLDPVAKDQVIGVMKRLQHAGKTIVWATQEMDEVGYADRVVALREGQVMFVGTPQEFFYGRQELDERRALGAACDEGHGDRPEECEVTCEQLGFRLPYGIEVVHHLHARGILTGSYPVRSDQCMEAVRQLCR